MLTKARLHELTPNVGSEGFLTLKRVSLRAVWGRSMTRVNTGFESGVASAELSRTGSGPPNTTFFATS